MTYPLPACTCSDRQLEQVGCDCEHQRAWAAAPKATVHVWPRGYAHQDGTRSFKVVDGSPAAEIEQQAFRAFDHFAAVAYVTRAPKLGPHKPISEAYQRAMSRNDNS